MPTCLPISAASSSYGLLAPPPPVTSLERSMNPLAASEGSDLHGTARVGRAACRATRAEVEHEEVLRASMVGNAAGGRRLRQAYPQPGTHSNDQGQNIKECNLSLH